MLSYLFMYTRSLFSHLKLNYVIFHMGNLLKDVPVLFPYVYKEASYDTILTLKLFIPDFNINTSHTIGLSWLQSLSDIFPPFYYLK